MSQKNLDNLVKTGNLQREPHNPQEFNGLVKSGQVRLKDACRTDLSFESRFDLGYNAAHALALAALRWKGYRSQKRYLVFQCLEHTLDIVPKNWRVLSICHEKRNLAEYEGHMDADGQLLEDMLRVTEEIFDKVHASGTPPESGNPAKDP